MSQHTRRQPIDVLSPIGVSLSPKATGEKMPSGEDKNNERKREGWALEHIWVLDPSGQDKITPDLKEFVFSFRKGGGGDT